MAGVTTDGFKQGRENTAPPVKKWTKLDALPEEWDYRDDGCDLAPSCLNCPFPVCRYDYPGGIAAFLRQVRDEEIRALRAQGVPPQELAKQFKISLRTVFRITRPQPFDSAKGPGRGRDAA